MPQCLPNKSSFIIYAAVISLSFLTSSALKRRLWHCPVESRQLKELLGFFFLPSYWLRGVTLQGSYNMGTKSFLSRTGHAMTPLPSESKSEIKWCEWFAMSNPIVDQTVFHLQMINWRAKLHNMIASWRRALARWWGPAEVQMKEEMSLQEQKPVSHTT